MVKAVGPTESGNCGYYGCDIFAAVCFIHKGVLMKKQRFHLHHIDMKYIRDLAGADDKVMSVSPQAGKERRPFVGIVVIFNQKKYCIPLTSPKPKHQIMKNDKDFSRIFDKAVL